MTGNYWNEWSFRRSTNGCSSFSYRNYSDRGYLWGLCVLPDKMALDVDEVDGAENEGMTIERIIAAIQRTTHLKRWELVRDYPEVFSIKAEFNAERDLWGLKSRLHEIIGRCPLSDRQFAPATPTKGII
jgi:hypothetical protein